MKQLLSITLAVSITMQSLVYFAIGCYYHINKEYIAKQLCINRNNPQLHCNGHCYLSKQLKKAGDSENKSAKALREKDEPVVLYNEIMQFSFMPKFVFISYVGLGSSGSIFSLPHLIPEQPPC